MRFLQRYDIQEPIASGPVEVFVGLEIDSGAKRLIHVVKIKGLHGEVSSEQALAMFRERAPDPLGTILEAGRFEKTSYIYVVTSLPADPLAVQRWVQRYRAFSEKQPVASPPPPQEPSQGRPHISPPMASPLKMPPPIQADVTANINLPAVSTPRNPPPQKAQPGEFTAAFQDVAPPPVSVAGNPVSESAKTNIPPSARHESGAFTKQFLAAIQEDPSNNSAKPVARTNPEPAAPELGSFTKEFFQVGFQTPAPETRKPQGFPSTFAGTDSPSVAGAPSKLGEFTQFFRGMPVENSEQARTSVPGLDEQIPSPKGHRSGDFTNLFGSMGGSGQAHPSTPPANRPASFSPVLDEVVQSTQLDRGLMNSGIHGSRVPDARPSLEQRSRLEPNPPGAIPEPMWGEENEGATKVFTPRAEPQVSNIPPEPAGPSEYTRVISASAAPPPASPAGRQEASARAGGGVPVAIPSVNVSPMQVSVSGLNPPHITPPHVTPPPIPHANIEVKLPPPPKPAPLPKAPFSYVPLIIVLNVLLIAAIALVLYFALKPH